MSRGTVSTRRFIRGVRAAQRGFTLVELIVAAVIVAFIGAATTVAVSSIIRARDSVAVRQQAFARAMAAADRIAQDIECAVRDGNLLSARVAVLSSGRSGSGGAAGAGGSAGAGGTRLDSLLLSTRQLRRVRPAAGVLGEVGEGGEYEVQYRADVSGPGLNGLSLWRRVDPNPDEVYDGGGVASPVIDGLVSLTIQASDTTRWYDQWDSDTNGYPHAVRVTVVAADDSGKYTAAARRTVALDRTPLPIAAEEDTTGTTGTTGSTTGSTGGTGTTGGTR